MSSKLLSSCLAVGALFALAVRADAQVLSFDEVAPPDATILSAVVCADTTGFRFVSDHFHLIGGDFLTDFSSNGTSYIGYESVRGYPITMERVGSGTFSLQALDAGEFYSPASPSHPNAQTLTLTGFQQGGGMVTHTLTLDGIHDGPGGAPDFEHFVLPNTFVNLTSVRFTGLAAGGLDGGVAMDNLEYQTSVPEVLAPCVMTPLVVNTPSVSIVRPVAGFVAGSVTIEAAPANFTPVSVEFLLDGASLGPVLTAAPFLLSWDSTTVADGPHTLTVEARDALNTLYTSTVTVTVRNQPVTGGIAHYVEFDGVDDYVQVADAPGLSFGTGTVDSPLTIELWFRPDAMGRHQLIGKWGETTNQEYKLHIVTGGIRVDLRDQSAQAGAYAFTTGNFNSLIGGWHHLAVTYDGRGGATAAQGLTMYVDGISVPLYRSTDPGYVAMENLADPIQIGRAGPVWRQYNGGLDDVRMWRLARTPAELQAGMATELTGLEVGLAAYWRFNEGTGPTASDAVSGDALASLAGGTTWMLGGPLASTEPDTTPPDIFGLATSGVTATQFGLGFETSEPTTAVVSYTAGTACPCITVASPVTGTTHNVTLTGLTPDTLYQYVVQATDGAGNVQTSLPATVRTLVAPPDALPPVVTITQPTGAVVAGTVTIAATATDNVGVASVQVRVDGLDVGPLQTAAPFSAAWDTTTVADGPHAITVEARDALNNVGTATAFVTVANTPVVTSPHFLEFDGVDDYVQVADAPGLSFGTGTVDSPLTIELWFRPDAMGRHQLIGKWGETTNQEYKLHIVTGGIRVDLRDQSAQAGAYAFTTGNFNSLIGGWHHLAVTYDGRGGATAAQGLTMYVDGVSVPLVRSTDPGYVAMENLADPLQIGRAGPVWRQYNGGLDDVRLWRVARSASEIQAGRTAELSGLEPGLAAYWRFNEGAGPTTADAVAGGGMAALTGGTAWTFGGPLGSAEPDTTPPSIVGLATSGVTATQAVVSFQTNEPTTAIVSYTSGAGCPCTTVTSPTLTTSHAVTLTGLTPDTLYIYTVQAIDAAGNPQTTLPATVRTLVPPPDAQPPAVIISQPIGGIVAGTVTIEATATDNVGVASVQMRVDGVAVGPVQTVAPFAATWDTTATADGPHTITVEARDALNNVGTATVFVTVRNTPIVTSPHFLEFDGVDDYVQVADAPGLSFGTGTVDSPLTVELWFRPDAMGRHQLLGKWGETTNQEYKLHIVTGGIRIDLRDQSAQAGAYAFTTGNFNSLIGSWHHLAVTYDGRGGATAAQGLTMYVDGVSVPLFRSTDPGYVAMENLADPIQIGRGGPVWRQYDGGLDDVRLWRVARSASEIQAGRTAELSGLEPGLAAYWRINEGAGPTVESAVPAAPAATLVGPVWVAGGPLP